jgi:hypothetical protein
MRRVGRVVKKAKILHELLKGPKSQQYVGKEKKK